MQNLAVVDDFNQSTFPNEENVLLLHAMHKFQKAMEGEAEKVGLRSEEDLATWISQSRSALSNESND